MLDRIIGLIIISLPLLMLLLAFITKTRVFKRLAIFSLIAMVLLRSLFYGSVLRFCWSQSELKGLSWEAYFNGVRILSDFYFSTELYPIVIAVLFAVLFFRSLRSYDPGSKKKAVLNQGGAS